MVHLDTLFLHIRCNTICMYICNNKTVFKKFIIELTRFNKVNVILNVVYSFGLLCLVT